MGYIPTTEKLKALGYPLSEQGNPMTYQKYWDSPDFHHSIQEIVVWPEGDMELTVDGSWTERYLVFAGECPSEKFFDQLLVAVGWIKAAGPH